MASKPRTMTVNFVGRTDQLDKAYKRVNKGSQNMATTLTRGLRTGMVAFAGIGAAAAGFVALTKPMVDMAADVGESMSKNKVLFGEAANSVTQFAETAATDLGLSKRAALEAAGNFGALTHAMKMSGEDGADMSITMVKLAADMASFNNASPEETLTALAAGLRGENEPLRRFGVLLDAATTKQKALEMGLIENTKGALDPATKALASYHLILEQSTVQQGDFQRTSDGLANSQRILAAQWEDLQTQLGEALLPIFTDITHWLVNEGIPNAQKFIDVWKDEGFFAALEKVGGRISDLSKDLHVAMGKGTLMLFADTIRETVVTLKDGINDALLSPFRLFDELAPGLLGDLKDAYSPLFGWLEGMASTAAGWWETIFGGGQEADTGAAVGSIMGDIRRAQESAVSDDASSGMAGFNPNVGVPSNLAAAGGLAGFNPNVGDITAVEELAAAVATNMPPVFTQAELDYFDKAVAAGFFGSQGGPAARGVDTEMAGLKAHAAGMMRTNTVTVNINAPAVTPDEVQTAIVKGFTDNSVGLSDLYFI